MLVALSFMLTPDRVDSICENLGFSHYPRAVGNPRQQFVYATEQTYRKFIQWEGENSCFISTAGYDNLSFDFGKQVPKSIIYGLTFFDFDHPSKPENAFADAQRLSQYLSGINVAHWVQYSGSKGYHLFVLHKPTRFKFDHKDGSSEALKNLVNQTQTHLKHTLGLNTLDEQTTGDPKRLCRMPYTRHVNKDGKVSGRYAMPVPIRKLETIGHDEIVNRSYRPQYFIPKCEGDRLTLREFISLIDVKLHKPETELKPVIDSEFGFADSKSETSIFLQSLNEKCMGVVNELKRRNPAHKARFHTAMFAKTLHMTQEQLEAVWLQLGTQMGYVDLHNGEHRRYQMATIFDDPRYSSVANCTTLKKDGCCVGSACPKFIDFGEVNQRKQIKRKWIKK